MQCPGCRRENPLDARFCMGCGRALARACTACGADLIDEANFCPRCGHPASGAAPAASDSLSGSQLTSLASGRYELKRLLGEGANKRVYLARDSVIEREVAVAAIKTEGLDPTGVQRVHHEARAMGRLGDHPNIVSVYDVAQEGSQLYIVAQYMSGGDLHHRLLAAEGNRLPVDEALRVAEDVCRALDHAHEQGIIHRDVKVGNIWLDVCGVGADVAGGGGVGVLVGVAVGLAFAPHPVNGTLDSSIAMKATGSAT